MKLLYFLIIFFILSYLTKAQQKNFVPYKYSESIEILHRQYSKKMMMEAKKAMDELNSINVSGKYKPDLQSLGNHIVPSWYSDAKLGIFFDWGLYSIAGYGEKGWSRARYPDWYLSHMYNSSKNYHKTIWGVDFQRDDFIPIFTANNFDAKYVIKLAKEAGAKYFVPFNKHHDGYCLWDSEFTRRDVMNMMPGRDLTKEIIEACRENDLKYGFYFSVEDYEYPIIDKNGNLKIRLWSKNMAPDNAGITEADEEYFAEFNSAYYNRLISGKIPVFDFVDEYIVPQAKDFIDKYQPDILWFDGEWQRPANYYKTPDIVAYFYNTVGLNKEVASNDRLGKGSREHSGDFYTSETDEVVEQMKHIWEENRSMSESYGFNQSDTLSNYLTPGQLIKMLVRIVAKGGNLNLIINPDGSGKIPELQVNLLKELGDWLKVNGEAIYGTMPYEVTCDNTQLGQPVWYTRSKDEKYGYAIIFEWPMSETFICKGANMIWEKNVYMLGYDKALKWVDTGKKAWGLSAKIPDDMLHNQENRPCKYAWVLKFEWDKNNRFGN